MVTAYKKKSKIEALNKRYMRALAEAHRLSSINLRASDQKIAEADRLAREIETIRGI